MESAATRLQKEAKGYLDSLRGMQRSLHQQCPSDQVLTFAPAMTASQMRIAETIDAFYGDAGTKDGVSRSYKQAVEDLDAETIKALDGPYRYVEVIRDPAKLLRLPLPMHQNTDNLFYVVDQNHRARAHLPVLCLFSRYQ
jgi:hypothetical protein